MNRASSNSSTSALLVSEDRQAILFPAAEEGS